ncbi:hypothetical protein [Cupriavidus necator]|uniref:hypothetical protein n=1 Tax=Cupriavidus necator TaxID=106590 RepID=UPI003F736C47
MYVLLEMTCSVRDSGHRLMSLFQAKWALASAIQTKVTVLVDRMSFSTGSLTMANWQVGSNWDIVQGNGFRVHVFLTQNEDRIAGSAETSDGSHVSSRLEGFVTDNEFHLSILWKNGSDGRYIGSFKGKGFPAGQGVLEGFTGDLAHPESSTKWFSENVIFKRA